MSEIQHIPGVITIDLRSLIKAMGKLAKNPTVKRLAREQADKNYLLGIADEERAIGRAWLDQHMDQMYEDLGLTREITV